MRLFMAPIPRTGFFAVLCAVCALGFVSEPAADTGIRDIGKRDVDFLRGKWTLVKIEFHQNDVVDRIPPNQFTGEMSIGENKYSLDVTIRGRRHSRTLGYILHPERTPKAFEAIDDEQMVYKGIYEIDGNTLRRCYAIPGKPRPTKFRAQGQAYQVWKWKGT